MNRSSSTGPARAALLALLAVLAWDASGADLVWAGWFGTPQGFWWRHNTHLVFWLHELPRFASWGLMAALFVTVRWPLGPLRRLDAIGRSQLALSVLVSVLAVSITKTHSATSCPWDLQAFGGTARYVSHWAWGRADGGPGHCFPAGHASAAFAYMAGWFAFRRVAPAVAWRWLAAALAAGLVLGLMQQLRGAHYMSHTLWTAWICWTVALGIDRVVQAWRARTPAYRADTKLNGT